MIATRLVAYAPNGAKLGILAEPASWSSHAPVNGVSSLTLGYLGSSVNAGFLASPVEVAVEVMAKGSTTWVEPANCRFLRLVRGQDPASKADLWSYQMPGYAFLLKGVQVLAAKVPTSVNTDTDGKRKFLSANAGIILKTILDEARAFDPEILDGLSIDFTTTKDSSGTNWSKYLTIYYEPGQGLDSILENLASQGVCDWEIQGRTLRAYNPDSTLARQRPQIRIHNQDSDQAPIKGTLEGLKHLVVLRGDDGKTWTRSNPSAPKPWGKAMALINQGGVKDEGTAFSLIQAELDAGARERVQYTRSLKITEDTVNPFTDYRPGDFITAKDTANAWALLRVFALGLAWDGSGLAVTLTLGDLFEDALLRQAKRTKGIVGGATTDGGAGGRPTPPEAGKRKPAKPLGLVVSSSHYFDAKGVAHAAIAAAYDASVTGVDGLALTMTKHELHGRKKVGGAYNQLTSVPGSEGTITFSPLPVDELWQVRVRAISENGVPSDFSNVVEVQLAKDTTPPGKPSQPTIEARTGVIAIRWDYLLATGGAMPADFDYVEVEVTNHGGTGFVPAGKITLNGGSLPVSTLPFDVVTQIRFIAVDTSGNRSVPSEITPVTAKKLVDTDLTETTIFPALDGVQADATAAATAAAQAKADALAAAGAASNAQSTANGASTAASNAAGAASAANTAALQAAGIANSKGEVIYQASAPTGTRANAANLWIRTSDNKPHTYNTSTTSWVAVTDKAATDAAAAAVTAQNAATAAGTAASNAQTTANGASTAASNAQAAANAAAAAAAAAQAKADAAAAAATTAQTTADGKNRLIRSSADPSGTGFKTGDQWWKYFGTRLTGLWIHDGSTWVSQVLDGAILAYIDAGTITVGFLSGERLEARSIAVEKLLISDFTNYIDNPLLERDGAGWVKRSGAAGISIADTTDLPGNAWKLDGRSTEVSVQSNRFMVQAGQRMRVKFRAQNNLTGGTAEAFMRIYWYNKADQPLATPVFWNRLIPYGSWADQSIEAVVPDGAYYGRLIPIHGSGITGGSWWVGNPEVRRMTAGELVVDGTIRAQHVKTNELTVQHFVAGALQAEVISVMSSDHAPGVPAVRIDGQGIKTFDREGGEAVSITGLGNDFITISKSNGEAVATVDNTGGAAFADLTVAGEARVDGVMIIGGDPIHTSHGTGNYGPVLNGRDLLGSTFMDMVNDHPNIGAGNAWLTAMPHGMVVNAFHSDGSNMLAWAGTGGQPHLWSRLQASYNFKYGRIYQIFYRAPAVRETGTTSPNRAIGGFFMNYSSGTTGLGPETGTVIEGSRTYLPGGGTYTTPSQTTMVRCPEDIPAGQNTLGITGYCNADRQMETITTPDQNRWEIAVVDLGMRYSANQGRHVSLSKKENVAPTPPTPPAPEKTQYTTTWNESWGGGYRGNNTPTSSNFDGKATQGYSPYATSLGVSRGLVGFPSLVSTLSGADVTKVEVYVYAAHWHSNAGGTLCIGGHTHASKPTTWSSNLNDAIRQKLKKPEGRWITLPSSMYAGFKSGLYKGISLLPPGSSTSTEYYGYIDWAKTKLRVTYKK